MNQADDLLLFLQVAEAGGFSAAERITGIDKSRLSRRIAALEQRLGMRLLHRSARSVSLTSVGEEVVQHARAMAGNVDAILQLGAAHAGTPRGTLHVNTSPLLGETRAARILGRFAASNPQVRLQITLTNDFIDLVGERADLAIRAVHGSPESGDVVARLLGTSPTVVVASPTLLARVGEPAGIDELPSLPCLALGTLATPRPWRFVAVDGRMRELRLEPVLTSESLISLLELARAGAGFAQLPRDLCRSCLRTGSLRVVLPDCVSQPADIYAMYPTRKGKSFALRMLLDHLHTHWADDAEG